MNRQSSIVVPFGIVVALLGLVIIGGLRLWPSPDPPAFPPSPVAAVLDAKQANWTVLASAVSPRPLLVDSLENRSADVVFGVLLALAVEDPASGQTSIDLTGQPRQTDRVALGLLELGVPFVRSGDDHGIISLATAALPPTPNTTESAQVQLAAFLELRGQPDGRIPARTEDFDAIGQLGTLAGIEIEEDPSGTGLWIPRWRDREFISGLAVVCADRMPIVGGRGCGQADTTAHSKFERFGRLDNWLRASTLPLDASKEAAAAALEGDIRRSNWEAQMYRPDQVKLVPGGVALVAEPESTPGVDKVPYASGMLISRERFGHGRFEFDVIVPTGRGLWPALWLLDDAACEGPGRCAGYESSDYLEIDALETRGTNNAHAAVHWFDTELRSRSSNRDWPSLTDGAAHTITLDRRPGLLQWSIDGEVVASVAEEARAEIGPHRANNMMVIMNLAVGGSFSGDRMLGPQSSWWGEALVPEGFPNVGWAEQRFVITGFRYLSL